MRKVYVEVLTIFEEQIQTIPKKIRKQESLQISKYYNCREDTGILRKMTSQRMRDNNNNKEKKSR